MEFSFENLVNAMIAGLLLGGFYAAITVGVTISFGILDIVNIAHVAAELFTDDFIAADIWTDSPDAC